MSLAYFEVDGYSFCGDRIYSLDPDDKWLSLDDGTLTITSRDSDQNVEKADFYVTVALKDHPDV